MRGSTTTFFGKPHLGQADRSIDEQHYLHGQRQAAANGLLPQHWAKFINGAKPGNVGRRLVVGSQLLLRCIGRGSYGEVWLTRNVMGTFRAVKVVYRTTFDHDRLFEHEFEGIQKFEPISRAHESQVDILHGRH